jgi:four helix bundle protein
MAAIEKFEDIEGWRLARHISNLVYDFTSEEACCRDYPFVNQTRRASVSIMSNIAEGFERDGNKEFLQFLSIAKGSCGEVRSQLYIAKDRGYINDEGFDEIYRMLIETSRILSGLMRYLRSADDRGRKYRD